VELETFLEVAFRVGHLTAQSAEPALKQTYEVCGLYALRTMLEEREDTV
jgi:hypothetical protein